MLIPKIIKFPSIGSLELGYLSIAENNKQIPFEVKRVFWAYYTPNSIIRGKHAHHNTEMILIAVTGKIEITTEMPEQQREMFVLENPNEGLYLPKFCWHTMKYSHNAVQVVLASSKYDESDYIRDYDEYLKFIKNV